MFLPIRFLRTRTVRGPLALLIALAVVLLTPGVSSALPTASFTFGPAAPAVAEPVTFTFTGSCDVAPCRIQWRWFTPGGSHLGTSMGEGTQITYAFANSGTYSVVARITNATSTHGSATATQGLNVDATFQDDNRAVRFGSWRGLTVAGASNGGHRESRRPGATAALTFAGPRITYVARTGPDEGIAQVSVDGKAIGALDLYAAAAGTRSRAVTGLGAGSHRIVIRPSGRSNPASAGRAVSVDGFVAGLTHVDDASRRVAYDGWSGSRRAGADGGSVRVAARAGTAATLVFGGTSVTWLTATGPDQGIARVVIDGAAVATVDNYAATAKSKVARTFAGLPPGLHVVRVVVLGQHRPSSTSNAVAVDAFVVH